MMVAGAYRSVILVSWLLFIPFVSGEDCAPNGSIENCDRCLKGSQCVSGFCCPYLKVCMASSSASCSKSRGTYAMCSPRCYDSMDPNDCKKGCQNEDFPQKWPKVCKGACIDKSSGCANWEKLGYCKDDSVYAAWMKENCAKSCKICKSSGSGGSSGSDYAEGQLKKHNELRKKHGSPAMTLDSKMNEEAEAWAKENAKNHKMKHSEPEDRHGHGENLWYGCNFDPTQATQDWYDEMTKPGYNFNNPGFYQNPGTGHFTQVVWKASTKLGIGKWTADDNCVYVCARYSPAGNMMGDFEANVKKPNN